jgi:hypothetical protein
LAKAETVVSTGRSGPDGAAGLGAKSNVVGTGEEAWQDEMTPPL